MYIINNDLVSACMIILAGVVLSILESVPNWFSALHSHQRGKVDKEFDKGGGRPFFLKFRWVFEELSMHRIRLESVWDRDMLETSGFSEPAENAQVCWKVLATAWALNLQLWQSSQINSSNSGTQWLTGTHTSAGCLNDESTIKTAFSLLRLATIWIPPALMLVNGS